MTTGEDRTISTAPPSIDDRVADLLKRMTLQEKLAQVGSEWAFKLVDADGLLSTDATLALEHGIGHVTRLAGSTNLPIEAVASAANQIQRWLVERTRLGIPAIIHEETLHGVTGRGAPVFQQSIGAAAAFDPELVEQVAATIRRRLLAMGARQALSPVLDTTRDPRWGRIEETYGEDPYLATTMGLAYVRGLQGSSLVVGVVATAKHLIGHGLAEGGLNQAPAHAGLRELHDEQFLPFEAAVRQAGLASVMPAYCEVDGVPCHMSAALLKTTLREEWGFDGIVVSDYLGIEQIATQHRLTADLATAAVAAIRAGVDVDLPRSVAYAEPLARAVSDGRLDEGELDRAVGNVLRTKLRLGLFDQPYVVVPSGAEIAQLETEERYLARRLAGRSIVLLENNGILPLRDKVGRVAVIGPHAASARDLLGDYSHVVHMATLAEADEAMLGGRFDSGAPPDDLAGRRTVLDALRDRFGAEAVSYAAGTGLRGGSDSELAAAVDIARQSDVAVVVLGERSGLTIDSTTGEFRDRQTLGFMGRQQELLEAVVETATPVVLVVISGRPLALAWAAKHCSAVLLAWVPGDAGPDAIADILSGLEAPGGKLPVTMLRDAGQAPLTYRHHASGGRSNPRGDHVDGLADPLWPFGHGLSYTTFELSQLELSATVMPTLDGSIGVQAVVTNTGPAYGDEVIQLYVRDDEAAVARPVLELCGFARVSLAPAESALVGFELHAEQFAYTSIDYRRVVEPGRITISVGTSSENRPLSATVELTGPVVEVLRRRRFVTPVSVT